MNKPSENIEQNKIILYQAENNNIFVSVYFYNETF